MDKLTVKGLKALVQFSEVRAVKFGAGSERHGSY
jgi:hypothetical protein